MTQLTSLRSYLQTMYPPQAPAAININTSTRQAIYTNGTEAPFLRIPSLIVTNKGTVLAFADARQTSVDNAITTVVCKRSTDGGTTWASVISIIGDGVHCFANNSPIYDRVTGRIHMLCLRYTPPDSQPTVIAGTSSDTARAFYVYSDDDGLNWASREITSSVKPAGYLDFHPGPGHSEQLANGRLVWPCYGSSSTIGSTVAPGTNAEAAYVVYSDDHGATFHIGAVTTISGLNENRVIQHPLTGQLMFTGRNENAAGRRFIWFSNDNGLTVTTPAPCWDQETQICNSSLYALGGNNVLHVGPIGPNTRDHLAARVSTDFGQSWPATTLIDAGASGYSDVVRLPNGNYAMVYESVTGGTFVFFQFTIAYPKWAS